MSHLVFVDRAADVPPYVADTDVVVLDAAWTPRSPIRRDVRPIRPIVQSVLDEFDVIDGSLAALDHWATAAGLPTAFMTDGVTWWYRARMLLRWDVHELVLWRMVLARIAEPSTYETITIPVGRPSLVAAAVAAEHGPGDGTGSTVARVIVAGRQPFRPMLDTARRGVRWLARELRARTTTGARRRAVLRRRFDELARRPGELVVLAWPQAFQVVGEDGGERRVDPYLVGALDRLEARGRQIALIGIGLDYARDADWALAEADPRLIPERFLLERVPPSRRGGDGSRRLALAIEGSAGVPELVGGVDLGPALARLVAPFAGRWLDRQRRLLDAAAVAFTGLRPAAMLTDREGSRTAWLAAARRLGVRSVTIQHGMIYHDNPEYFQAPHEGRIRPDATCVFGDFERGLLVDGAGFEPDRVIVTGSPRPLASQGRGTAADRERVRASLGVRPTDRLLLVSVAHNEVLGELNTFGLLERTLGGPLPGVHLVIKLHPQDRAAPRHASLLRALAEAGGYEPPRVSIVRDIDLYELLDASDAHLGQYSTVLSDAVVSGTPNMIAIGHAHADALGYVAAGVATPVRSVEEVRAFMADPPIPDPLARRRFLDAHYRPGDAAGRLADVVEGVDASSPSVAG